MIEISTDLNRDLELKSEVVTIADGMLKVSGGAKTLLSIDTKRISSAYIEEGLGIGHLIVCTKDGTKHEAAYFTKARIQSFRKFSDYINEYTVKGRDPDATFESKKKRAVGRISTLKWLYGFASDYKRDLYLGAVFSLLVVFVSLVPPYLLKVLVDSVILSPSRPPMLFEELTLVLIGSYIISMIVSVFQNYYMNLAGNKIVTKMRARLFAHSIRLPATFIDNISFGRILSRLMNDVGNTQWLMTFGFPSLITNLLMLIGIGIILFSMFPALAVYVLLPMPVIALLVIHYKMYARKVYHRNYRTSADMTSKIADVIPNYVIVKASANEGSEDKRFEGILDRYYMSQMDVQYLNISHWPAVGFLTAIGTVLVWWVGGNLVIAGSLQLGIITAFIAYLGMFYSPITQLGNIIPFVQSSITSGDRLRELMEVDVSARDGNEGKRPSLTGDIEFRDVSFSYESIVPAVKHVNLQIVRGKRTALVGKSGSGKTTLTRLMLRLYDSSDGSIKISGNDILEINPEYLRKRIAYVPQEIFFFDDTVFYNVGYYQGNSTTTEVMAACLAAGMHDEVMRLPLAYDTNIAYGGARLSGGQRQRLSIARAMLAKPDIVILDEVTSNLDAINAQEVDRAITNLTAGKTTVWVTHSANEVLNSDYVFLMDRGEMIEHGNPTNLLKRKTRLRRMFKGNVSGHYSASRSRARHSKLEDYIGPYIVKPSDVRVSEGDRPSRLVAYNGRKRFEDVMPKRPFPVTHPDIIALYGKDEKLILILGDYTMLGVTSAKVLESALALNDYKPKITGIRDIDITGDGLDWHLKTTAGELTITTRGRRNVLQFKDRVVLIDEYSAQYNLVFKDLDPGSIAMLRNSV